MEIMELAELINQAAATHHFGSLQGLRESAQREALREPIRYSRRPA